MKNLFLTIIAAFCFISLQAQDVQICKAVNIHFFSEAPLENIEAVTEKGVAAINPAENSLYFEVPIESFDFEKDLMEEHFNENYMESNKFPTAQFNGTFTSDIDWKTPGEYDATVTGTMNIHGVENEMTDAGKLIIGKDGNISIESVFNVKLVDHDIDIPKIVIKNIAEVVEVTVKGTFAPMK